MAAPLRQALTWCGCYGCRFRWSATAVAIAGICWCPDCIFRRPVIDVCVGPRIWILSNLFQYHVKGNLVAPTLTNQGDHPLWAFLFPLLADQDVRPASLLHLLHGLSTLADHHPNRGVGHHDLHRPLALGVAVVELLVALLHLLHKQLDNIRDGIPCSCDQAHPVLRPRIVFIILTHHNVGTRRAPQLSNCVSSLAYHMPSNIAWDEELQVNFRSAAQMPFCIGAAPILRLHIIELHRPFLCQLKRTIQRTVAVVAHGLPTLDLKQLSCRSESSNKSL